MKTGVARAAGAAATVGLLAMAGQAMGDCPDWDRTIGDPGATSPVPQHFPPFFRTFSSIDHGDGQMVYAAGEYIDSMDGNPVNNVAVFDGADWHDVAGGITSDMNIMRVLSSATFEDSVYFGGIFTHAGGVPTSRLARFDGRDWHPVDQGLGGNIHPTLISARTMMVWDDGDGEALYIGGRFKTAGNINANSIARYHPQDGWSTMGQGLTGNGEGVNAMVVYDDKLWVAGTFFQAGGQDARWMAAWDGDSWSALPPDQGLSGQVEDLIVWDDGDGEMIYAVGAFSQAGGQDAGVARFDGETWEPFGDPTFFGDIFGGTGYRLEVHDDGSGEALFAVGAFEGRVAKWDGEEWGVFEGGLSGGEIAIGLKSIDGSLYIGGNFSGTTDGTVVANGVIRWTCDEPVCIADWNGDGEVDVNDFFAYLSDFEDGDPRADLNNDGEIDINDFFLFLQEFEAGC